MNEHVFDSTPEQTTKISPIDGKAEFTEDAEHGLSAQDRQAVEALPAGTALLIVRKGPNMGARFLLDSESTVAGRNPESEIFLDDVTVSRKHATFVRTEGGFLILDMGSLNGTYVNRELTEEAHLSNGDEIQIGKYRFTFFTLS